MTDLAHRPVAPPPPPPAPVRTTSPALGHRARRDRVVRHAAGSALWLSLLLVTYWWISGGGVQDLADWGEGLTSLGRLTGLVASVLLLAQVLLMARVPALEAAYGQDRLARIHRWVGFSSFNLMVAHILLVTWGYAAGDLLQTPRMLWDLTVDYPGMLLAVAGTVCLVMVVVTSVKTARRRLRYESWHLMHLYAYLGVGLALPHQLWTGQDFVSSTSRTVFWWTAWALTAAAVLLWRVVLPVVRTLRHGLRVTAVVPEAPGVVSVHLTGRHLDKLGAEPGQFLVWRFLGRRGWTRANPYSLSSAPDGRTLRITVQAVGDGSAALAALRPGSRALVEGAYGRLSPRARTRPRVALIGAGLGMAPLRSLAEGLDYGPGEAVVLHRYSSPPLFASEFRTLSAQRGLEIQALGGPRRSPTAWLGARVHPQASAFQTLLHMVPDIAERDVYVCGPQAWTDLVRADLQRAGLPPERLHLETFGW